MITLSELLTYTGEYLDVSSIKDYAPIGLQVEGRAEVNRIVTGVSACVELFEAAVEKKADAVLVHHGMFWDSDPKVVRGGLKKRLKILLDNDISLIAYHLPLDRHPEVGNNAQIVKKLGLVEMAPFGDYRGKTISFMAKTPAPMPASDFFEKVKRVINPDAKFHAFGPDTINSVAICSGSAADLVREAISRGADLFLTGEDSEWVYHLAKEEGIHFAASGHHATERFGIIALGDHLAEKFGIEIEFVDIHNPI